MNRLEQRLTCHCENTDEKADASSGQHNLLLRIVTRLLLAGSPEANGQDEDVKQHDGDNSRYVDHLAGFAGNPDHMKCLHSAHIY